MVTGVQPEIELGVGPSGRRILGGMDKDNYDTSVPAPAAAVPPMAPATPAHLIIQEAARPPRSSTNKCPPADAEAPASDAKAPAGKSVAFKEALQPEFRVYAEQVVSNASALAAGVDPVWAFAYSAGGAAAGLVAMQPMAKAMFRWWSRRRRERGKRTFTLGRRRLVGIKLRFGLLGIAAISGIIGVPVAGLVAFKYFGHERRTLPVLVVAYVLWSAILTLLASTALI